MVSPPAEVFIYQGGLCLFPCWYIQVSLIVITQLKYHRDFPGGAVVKILPSNAWGTGSIPSREAKITRALRPKNQNIRQKQYCNRFNKDFKNGTHQESFKKN